MSDRIVKSEHRLYFVTIEKDHGILDKGAFKGLRFVTTTTFAGDTPEEADRAFDHGGRISTTGYRIEAP